MTDKFPQKQSFGIYEKMWKHDEAVLGIHLLCVGLRINSILSFEDQTRKLKKSEALMYDMGVLLLVKILTLIHQNELPSAAVPLLCSHFLPLVLCFIHSSLLMLPVSVSSMAFPTCLTTDSSDGFDE